MAIYYSEQNADSEIVNICSDSSSTGECVQSYGVEIYVETRSGVCVCPNLDLKFFSICTQVFVWSDYILKLLYLSLQADTTSNTMISRMLVSLALFFTAAAAVSAFQPTTPLTIRLNRATYSRRLHASDPNEVSDLETPSILPESMSSEDSATPKTVINVPTGEEFTPKWVDPSLEANMFELSWWAYLLVGYVGLVYLNDIIHFVPKEGLFR